MPNRLIDPYLQFCKAVADLKTDNGDDMIKLVLHLPSNTLSASTLVDILDRKFFHRATMLAHIDRQVEGQQNEGSKP